MLAGTLLSNDVRQMYVNALCYNCQGMVAEYDWLNVELTDENYLIVASVELCDDMDGSATVSLTCDVMNIILDFGHCDIQ